MQIFPELRGLVFRYIIPFFEIINRKILFTVWASNLCQNKPPKPPGVGLLWKMHLLTKKSKPRRGDSIIGEIIIGMNFTATTSKPRRG